MAKKFPTPKTAKRVTDDRAVYVISIAAELAGVHPQTLRMYERKGLLRPARTAGRARRYSARDIAHVSMIQELTQEHRLSLSGVEMVMSLQRQIEEMADQVDRLRREADRMRKAIHEATATRALVPVKRLGE
ncbi:MAG: heat shock protein transcriptional repressor HspR [Actinomycetota bacterium]|nr:MerR family transcriptional regulator [Actinomycetota bacterium]